MSRRGSVGSRCVGAAALASPVPRGVLAADRPLRHGAAIAAIGLTLLIGITGQLSLAHAFFIAVGAYGYCYLAGHGEQIAAVSQPVGLGLPPWLAAIGAVVLAGIAGALFSPIAGRLRGIYLGLASIGLVFVGQHILQNAPVVTGGFNGRDAAAFELFGLRLLRRPRNTTSSASPTASWRGSGTSGCSWSSLSWWFARNLLRGPAGPRARGGPRLARSPRP